MNKTTKLTPLKNSTGNSASSGNSAGMETPDKIVVPSTTPNTLANCNDLTPNEKPENYFQTIVFIKELPSMDYVMVKGTQKPLLNITGHNYLGQAILIQYWGDSAETMLQVFNVSMTARNNHTYAIQSGASVPSNDKLTMYLKEFLPNTFQVNYDKVFKLVCRSPGVVNGKLTPIAFLKAKKWPDNATLPDGTIIPPPVTWPPNNEVGSKFSIEDLAEEDDLEILSSAKKQKFE